jgi:hypothetical protein
LFSVVDFDGVTQLETIEFEKVALLVLKLHLPLACVGPEIGYQIGAIVGYVEEVDIDEDGMGWGQFLRVEIHADLMKPLPRGC